MRVVQPILLLLFLLPHQSTAYSGCERLLEKEIGQIISSRALPGAQFALQQADEPILAFAFGDARPGVPMQIDTALQIASLTKVLTGIAALDANDSGILPIDTPVIDAIRIDPSTVGYGVSGLTIAHLLAHRGAMMKMPGPDEMLRPQPRCPGRTADLLAAPLIGKPGRNFVYSNVGYCMIGEALASRYSLPFERVIDRAVVRRIGSSTIMPYKEQPDVEYHASPDDPADDPRLFRLNYAAMRASGGYAASARDLVRLFQSAFTSERRRWLDNRPQDCVRQRGARHCHGSIFHVAEHPLWGGRVLWRDGSLPGVTAMTALSVDGEWSWVLLTNQRRRDWMRFNEKLLQDLNQAVASFKHCRGGAVKRSRE